MPIIDAVEGRDYTMTSTAQELLNEVREAQAQTWKLHGQLSRTELELAAAEQRASYWAALCVALLIIAALLCAALALAT